ncbi:unnamed protein product, partial [Rotaria socialis]
LLILLALVPDQLTSIVEAYTLYTLALIADCEQ